MGSPKSSEVLNVYKQQKDFYFARFQRDRRKLEVSRYYHHQSIISYLFSSILNQKNSLALLFSGQPSYPHRSYGPVMAGIFVQLIRSKKQVLLVSQRIQPIDTRVLELQAAKGIIQEVFGARPEDVEVMIQAKIAELEGLY